MLKYCKSTIMMKAKLAESSSTYHFSSAIFIWLEEGFVSCNSAISPPIPSKKSRFIMHDGSRFMKLFKRENPSLKPNKYSTCIEKSNIYFNFTYKFQMKAKINLSHLIKNLPKVTLCEITRLLGL